MTQPTAASCGTIVTRNSHADRWISRTAAATVAALAGLAGAISYGHMHQLARLHGQAGWYAHAFPLSVDGIEVVASLVLLADRRAGRRSGWLPWAALAVGTAGSLAANVATAAPSPISRLIAVKLLSGMLDRDTAHRTVPGIPPSHTTADGTTDLDHAPSPLAVPVSSSARPPAGDPVPSDHQAGSASSGTATVPCALPGPPASRKAQGPFPAADLGPVPSIAELLPAALAARDGLHRDGSPLTRDALARRLRQNGHPIRNSRITPLLHALRTETTATWQTEL
jgi:hypothetical protein